MKRTLRTAVLATALAFVALGASAVVADLMPKPEGVNSRPTAEVRPLTSKAVFTPEQP